VALLAESSIVVLFSVVCTVNILQVVQRQHCIGSQSGLMIIIHGEEGNDMGHCMDS
jgi:hypothetical protein